MEFDCPKCGQAVLLISYPTIEESRANWEKLSDAERQHVEAAERFHDKFEREKLKEPSDLPEIPGDEFVLTWDFVEREPGDSRTIIKVGDEEIFSEPAVYEGYERFNEVAEILKSKYGPRVRDLIPSEASLLYLYGDRLSAQESVESVRRRVFAAG